MAKYISINELETFSLHDARFISVEIKDENMIWELEQANVTTENSQNDLDCDMETDKMRFTFYDFTINDFYVHEVKYYDKSGKLTGKRPRVTIPASDYKETILSFSEDYCWIDIHEQYVPNEPLFYSFCIMADYSYILIIKFTKIVAEWDAFVSNAWYVDWGNKN